MEIRNIFKISRKTFFNPSAWLGYDALKDQHRAIKDGVKQAFRVEAPVRVETFEEAMVRLELTEADVQSQIISFRRFTLIFCVFAALVFFYAFHLLFKYMYFTPWLMGMGVTGLLLAQAFKYHFWAYQMQSRRLGITFNEWKDHILGKKSTNP